MANSTSPVPQVVEGSNAVAKINQLFDAMSQGLIGGKNWATSALLTWGYLGGRVTGLDVANGTVTLTGSTTNYIVMKKSDGVVSTSTGTTNWNSGNYWRLYSVVTNSTTVTSYTDERFSAAGLFEVGAGLTNPMTTAGDMIVGGSSGTPNRLAPGTNAYVLTMVSGAPAWAVAGAATADMLSPLVTPEISITGAATATIDCMHVCSGTSADYTLALPPVSGNAGRFIGIRIAAACTRWITIDGDSTDLIDGSLTRRMWRYESAVLFCDGASWTKVAGKTIPIQAKMYRSSSLGILPTGWFQVPTTGAVVSDNTSAMAVPTANLTSGAMKVLRAGNYNVSAFCGFSGVSAGDAMAIGAVNYTGSFYTPDDGPWAYYLADSSGNVYGQGGGPLDLTLGADVFITVYNGSPSTVNTSTGASTRPSIAISETPIW